MPTDSMVISASVVSGEISEMAPTVVVLPTPKPPATMILTGTGGVICGRSSGTRAVPTMRWSGDGSKSTDHSHDGLGVGEVVVQHMDVQLAGGPQVADEDPGDAEVQPQPGGDLRDRQRLDAERDDGALLRRKPGGRAPGWAVTCVSISMSGSGPSTRPDVMTNGRSVVVCSPGGWSPAGGRRLRPVPRRAAGLCRNGRTPGAAGCVRVVGVGRIRHCWTAFFNSAMRRGLRAPPARVANRVISYARVPRLAVRSAMTPSTEPALMAVTSR